MMERQAQIADLVRCPTVAWPTVALFFLCYGIIGAVWYTGINDTLPLWSGAIINGITAYFLFSVVHDSSHNSLSRNKWINEALVRIGLVYFAPLAPMDVARYIHMAHHKYANDPVRDPDAYSHKLDWLFPIRWANFDYFYTKFFFQQGGTFAKRKYPALGGYVAFILGSAAFITWAGYGYELLILWFVPTRISSFLFVYVFSLLAHQPFETLVRDDEYRATALRLGTGWLLSPLMANHNYHLIHHLHISAPFYRYQKIWKLRANELRQHPLLTPPTFGLSPTTKH
jgi:beta-carotene hydroxylase